MFEFSMHEDPNSIEPPPCEGDIVLTVANGDALLLRCRYLSEDLYTWEVCRNWTEIKALAHKLIGANLEMSMQDGIYSCPPQIYALAEW